MRESRNPKLDSKSAELIDEGYSTAKIVDVFPKATRYRVQQVRYKRNLSRQVSDNWGDVEREVLSNITHSKGAATERIMTGSGALGIHSEHYEPKTWRVKFATAFLITLGVSILFLLGLSMLQ